MYALYNMLVMCEELTSSLCVDIVCLRELSTSHCIQCRETYCVRSVRLEVDNKRIYKKHTNSIRYCTYSSPTTHSHIHKTFTCEQVKV